MGSINLIGVLAESGADQFSITNLLVNAGTSLRQWGSLIVFVAGIVAIIIGVVKLVSGLASHGQKQTSWVVVVLLFIVGGLCTLGGSSGAWNFIAGTVAGGGRTTVEDMGTKGGGESISNVTIDGGGLVLLDTEANTVLLAA